MEYKIIKFHFNTAVHFGDNNLSDTNYTFSSDILFSAICVEKAKSNKEYLNEFVEKVNENKILFSDAFPYIDDEYFLPKPIMHINGKNSESDSVKKKAYKKMNYINIKDFDKFVNGEFDNPEEINQLFNRFGKKDILTRVNIEGEATRPYQVGVYKYNNNAGLYVIIGYEDENVFNDMYDIIIQIGYVGIGGKKSSGLGKFNVEVVEENEYLYKFIREKISKETNKYMSLSVCLPKEEEMETSIKNSTYTLVRKGGFVDTIYDSITKIKKKEIYLFKSGSCFENKFGGDVYNISFDEDKKIFKYAKPLWIGV